MKQLLFLLLIPVLAFGQILPLDTRDNQAGYFKTNNGTAIYSKAFTASTADTSEVIRVAPFKTHFIKVQANDSTTIIIAYALSDDGANFTAFTTKDSLSHSAAGTAVKSIDMTSTFLGYRFAKLRFTHSANAFAVGTTSPTYHASFVLKKN